MNRCLSFLVLLSLWTCNAEAQVQTGVAPDPKDHVSVSGVKRQNTIAAPTANGTYGLLSSDGRGLLYVNPWGSDSTEWFHSVLAADVVDTTATTVQAATAAKYHHLTNVRCTNTSAIASRIDIIDNASVVWSLECKAGDSCGEMFNPPLVAAAINTPLKIQAATTATATRCGMNGFDSAAQ